MPLNFRETTADWLVCQCGNEPHLDGFYACREDGTPIEPVIGGEWDGSRYVCAKCYSIYNIDTFDEVGYAFPTAQELLKKGITL
jgi:hypothetical protein